MIIGLTGYAGAGKDAVANVLVEQFAFRRIAFADKLKEFVMRQNPTVEVEGSPVGLANLVSDLGWDQAKQNDSVRTLLQTTGSGLRQTIDDAIWINAFRTSLAQSGYQPGQNVVVPDVRFPNEVQVADKLWRVERPNGKPVNDHESEILLDAMGYDTIVNNDGDLSDLESAVRECYFSMNR